VFWISTMTNSPFLFSTRISTRLNLSSSVSLFPSLSRICFILKSSWSNSDRKPSKMSKLALFRSSRIFRADAPNFCPPSLTAVRQNRCQSIYYICRGGLICQDRSAIFRADAPNICPPSLPTVRQNLLKINILYLSRRAFCQARSAVFRADALSKINIYIRRRARLPLLVGANYCLPDH